MKPGKYDRKHQVRITGAELRAVKQLDLAESFGLNRRIEHYQGRRPIGLYRWDLECLLAAVSVAIEQNPFISRQDRGALRRLHDRLQAMHDAAYRRPRA